MLDATLRSVVQTKFPHLHTMSLSKDICLHGTQYAKDMVISAGYCSGQPEFFKIESIMLCFAKVSFISKRLSAWYIEHLRSYELVANNYADMIVLDTDYLNDYHTSIAYSFGEKVFMTQRSYLCD